MRKRVWTFIRQADILIAFQAGMPSMIELPVDESSMPGNFYDDEAFGEECTALPEVLPDSEPTQVSFLIAKSRMAFGFALALKEVSSTAKIRSERILELDRDLRNLYNNVPEKYQLRQLSTQDSLILTSARFVLAGIHHKSLCVIHSRFLEVAGDNDNCAYSRRVCLSSAMSILRFQVIQNEKLPINGRLRSITNYQNSLTIHDYLLAATIISAELCSGTDFGAPTEQASTQGELSRSNMIRALRSCARIFSQTKDRSMEAYKAADILHMLIQKFRSTRSASQRSAAGSDETQSSPAVVSIGEKFNPFTPNLQSLIRAPGSVHNNISSSLAGGESTGHDRMANDSDSEFCNFQLGAANDTFAEETNVDLSATKWSIGDWRTINESFDPPWAFPQADTELGDIASWIRSGNF
jgi:hypothetical protein